MTTVKTLFIGIKVTKVSGPEVRKEIAFTSSNLNKLLFQQIAAITL